MAKDTEILHPIQSMKHTGEQDFRPGAVSKSAFQKEAERQEELERLAKLDAERDALADDEEPKTAFEAESRAGRRPFGATDRVDHVPQEQGMFDFPPSKTEGSVDAAKENHPATAKSRESLTPPSTSSPAKNGKQELSA